MSILYTVMCFGTRDWSGCSGVWESRYLPSWTFAARRSKGTR